MTASPRPFPAQPTPSPASAFVRRRDLPALALPRGREDRRASALLSLLVHGLIVMLLVTPFAVHHVIVEREQGAGGPGPAGGGGGGHGGTGGSLQDRERVQFVRVEAAPTAATAPPEPVVSPPTPVPPPEPVKVEPVPTPTIQAPVVVATPAKLPEVAATSGVGGGSGRDGTDGSGPGTGGGVGTGTGTGRGSGVGPGTGGGTQENYPPTATVVFIPPMPVPSKVRGMHVVAEFDVDSTGRVVSYDFTPTRDRDYNKRLDEAFRGFRFKPGTRPDGRPLRMKTTVGIDLP
jgi:periplasmic protein TonB